MAQTNDKQQSSLLDDFALNDQENWFGIQPEGEPQTTQVVKEVKSEKPKEKKEEETDPKKKVGTTVEDDEEDDEDVTFDFGGDDDEVDEKPKPKEKEDKKEDKKDKKDKKDKLEDDEDINKDVVEAKKDDVKNPADEEDDDQTEFYTTLTKELKENGVFQTVDIKDGEPVTIEKFFELQEQEIEARVQEAFEGFAEELDDDAKAFIKFKKDGGKTADFFSAVEDDINLDEFDESNPKQVKQVLNHYLTNFENLDSDELESRLEWLKDGGKEAATAKKYFDKIKAHKAQIIVKATKAAEDANKAREKGRNDFNKDINQTLQETDKVGIIPIGVKDKKELATYITKPTVKVGKDKYIPQLTADLSAILNGKTKKDQQALVALAKVIKERFNLTDLVTETASNVTRTVKSNLKTAKETGKVKSSGSSVRKSLVDLFD